jgi:hypothetical protein
MQLILNIDIKKLPEPIRYEDKIMLIGSCFTEHIGGVLEELKFSVLQNPNGILFDPTSVCRSLLSHIKPRLYTENDLFNLNETWHSWDHHSRFSNVDKTAAIEKINASQKEAHDFLKNADWLIVTLGSSFSYQLEDLAPGIKGSGVANCHRAPAQWFQKHLLEINETIEALDDCCKKLTEFNPELKIIFTVSPVRHIRDGVVENNRSKARLIEAVHHVVSKYSNSSYFPSYELVIDVLRDYRFYDIDMVHPNYPATEFVLEKFAEACIDDDTRELMQDVKKIVIARKHKAFQPTTQAHKKFLADNLVKATTLQAKHKFLDFAREIEYFSNGVNL